MVLDGWHAQSRFHAQFKSVATAVAMTLKKPWPYLLAIKHNGIKSSSTGSVELILKNDVKVENQMAQ